jgi:hypothetical protein
VLLCREADYKPHNANKNPIELSLSCNVKTHTLAYPVRVGTYAFVAARARMRAGVCKFVVRVGVAEMKRGGWGWGGAGFGEGEVDDREWKEFAANG